MSEKLDWAEIAKALALYGGILWAMMRWLLWPRIERTIDARVDARIGDALNRQAHAVEELAKAVNRMEGALEVIIQDRGR